MFRVVLLLIGFLATATADHNLTNHIVGGLPTTIELHPHQVSIRDIALVHFCGGSILTRRTIVTAAHCVNDVDNSEIVVVAGTSFLLSILQVTRPVLNIILHPSYNSASRDNDIALLILVRDLSLGITIRPISLGIIEPITGILASVTGWGALSEGGPGSNQLLVIYVPIISLAVCIENYRPDFTVTNNMICAGFSEGGTDACQGDSGSPLVIGNLLIGIVSWGRGCARPNKPGVYTNVLRYRTWISDNSI